MIPFKRALPTRPPRTLPTAACHASTLSNRNSQTMRLPDGRTLGFSEHGRETDYPLIFMHGYPTSRLESVGIDDLARRQNLRIITPDRNGYGLTTFDPQRRIVDWPDDIKALAEHLGITRFAVLGGSGGSPYALACAYRLPQNMLSGVGIMAGAGPWEAGAHHMKMSYRLSAMAAHHWPAGYRGLWNFLVWMLKRQLESPSGMQHIDKALKKHMGEQDSMTPDELRDVVANQVFEAFRQGSEPAVYDARLLTSNWGIKFEDVTEHNVRIWHGSQDTNAPVEMMRYLAERLPRATLQEFADDTHFTLSQHLDQFLSELVPEQARAESQMST